jgi:hypothetical protein
MKVFRQLGTWGSAALMAPLFWIGACFLSRSLAQHAYDTQITSNTRSFRVPIGEIPKGGTQVTDRRVLTELDKYVRVWNLEPGASSVFPDAKHWPWSWNPFQASALVLRLKQRQAFLLSQSHELRRNADGSEMLIAPDGQAALGGRTFRVELRNGDLIQAFEL